MKKKAPIMTILMLVLIIFLSGCNYSVASSKIWKDAKQTLQVKWDLNLGGELVKYLISDGKAYFITDNQKLIIVDAETGKVIDHVKLNFSTKREIRMLSQNQDLLAMNFTDSIKVINLKYKKVVMDKKLTDLPMYTSGSLLVYKNTVLYEELASHDVVALDVQSGKVLWRKKSDGAHSVELFAYGGHCFVNMENDIYDVEVTTGAVLAKYSDEKIKKYQGSHKYVNDIIPTPSDTKIYEYLKWEFCSLENSKEGFAYEVNEKKLNYYGRGTTLLWELDLLGSVVDEKVYNRLAILTEEDDEIDIIDLEKKKVLFRGYLNLLGNNCITVDDGFLYVPCSDSSIKAYDLKHLINN